MAQPKHISGQLVNIHHFKGKLSVELECQKYAQDAINALVDILNDEYAKGSDRIKAAETILSRAYGTPMQRSVQLTLDNTASTGHSQLNTRQLLQLMADKLQVSDITADYQEVDRGESEGTPGVDFETSGE
jgi:hypothetical protein